MSGRAPSSPLGDVSELIRNGLPIGSRDRDSGLPVTRIETIAEHEVDPARVGYAGALPRDHERWLLRPGDLLFSHINSAAHLGKCALYRGEPERLLHGVNLLLIRPRRDRVEPGYLLHALRSPGFRAQLAAQARPAVNQSSVSIAALRELRVPVPPLAEQRRVAEVLDAASALRRKRRQAMALADALLGSCFFDRFGDPRSNPHRWPAARLGQLVADGDRINYGVLRPGPDTPGGVPLVRVGDLGAAGVACEGLKRISPSVEARYRRSRLRGDELLVACVGSVGKVALADERLAGANVARAVARVRVGAQIDRVYLVHFLQTPFAQRYFAAETRVVSQPTLNLGRLAQTPVLVPPLDRQRAFARLADDIGRARRLQADALGDSEALFASLFHGAFREV